MNVVDSSAWLEYLAGGPQAEAFAGPVEDTEQLVVPSITVLEVFRRVMQQRGENDALRAVALMQQGIIVDLDTDLAVAAAALGVREKLPLADSVILATARRFAATLWTMDADFKGLAGVQYRPRA